MSRDPRQRPPIVVGYEWAIRITTISLEMALPPALGYYLDERWGTDPWLVSVGAVLGFAAGIVHLIAMSKPPGDSPGRPKR